MRELGPNIFDLAAGRPSNLVPSAPEAEQGLLGALLVDNRAFERVSDFLKAEHFHGAVNGRIYEAIGKLIVRGKSASPVTLKAVFQGDAELAGVGGAGYLSDLLLNVVTTLNVADYGQLIVEAHARRQIIEIGDEMIRAARVADIDQNAAQIMEQAEQRIFVLGGAATGATGGPKAFSGVLTEVIQTAQRAYRREPGSQGISTGLIDLDKKLSGLKPGDLLVLAGRPAMGKSSLGTNIAFTAARAGHPVAFFSLEMTAEQLGHRIVCQCASIDSDRVLRGELSDDEFRRFVGSTQALASVPLHIDESAALAVAQIRTRARRLARQGGLALIVVDYLQLVRGSGNRQANDNRANEVSEITRGLKATAKDLGVPVLLLSQVNRGLEARDDKRPQMSDLKESGGIEENADVVMFVYREEYYLNREEPQQKSNESPEKFSGRQADWVARKTAVTNLGEIIIAKNRKGPTGTVKVHWDGPTTTFSNLTAYYSAGAGA